MREVDGGGNGEQEVSCSNASLWKRHAMERRERYGCQCGTHVEGADRREQRSSRVMCVE
jgi:hypothetical protein